jgi:hypothetical protein
MIPFIIAGAVGFGIAKLFEKDDNKKFADGGEAGENLENYSDYDEFYNVVFDYIKREENLTEEETKDICNVNESIIEAEFEGGSSPRFTGDVVLGYLSNERAYKNYAKGGEAGDEIIDLGNDFSIVLKKAYFTDGSYTYGCHLNYKGELFKYFVMIPNETKEGALENVYNYLKSLSSGQAHIDHPRKGQTLVFYKDRGASEMKMVFEGSDSFKEGTNFVNDIKDISSKKFAGGGKVGMIRYYIGGLVSEDIPFEYNGEETDINYEVGFHEGGIDLETFKETPSGYYVRIMPYGSTDIRRFIYPEKDIEIAYLSELRAITMLLFEANKDTKENQKIAIKEGKKNLPKLLKYMSENLEEEDRFRKNVRKVQDDMWGSDEDEDEYADGGVTKKRRRRANAQTGRTDRSVDKTRVGKPVGYRFTNSLASKLRKDEYAVPTEKQITKYIGKGIYKENRRNRSDRDRTVKL